MKKYTLIVKRKGHEDIVREHVDELDSIIIPAEMKMAFPKEFETGRMSITVKREC